MKRMKLLALMLTVALSSSIGASGPADIADAAQAKNAAAVKKLLKDGADVNAAQGDGMTALHWAALNGDAKAALEILKHQHDWVAKQQVQVDVNQQISITAALAEAQRRVIDVVATQLEDQSNEDTVMDRRLGADSSDDRLAVRT